MVEEKARKESLELSKNVFIIDEFLAKEIRIGNITEGQFSTDKKNIVFHGHCHQKSQSEVTDSVWLMSLPKNYSVEMIPSGCCGMAGSFGYEKEHYEVSQQVGELVLFPALRKIKEETIVSATGTSCRHQIKDGVGIKSLHPVEVLWGALK